MRRVKSAPANLAKMSHVKKPSIRSREESHSKKIFVIPKTKSYKSKMYKLEVIDDMINYINEVDNKVDYMNEISYNMMDNVDNLDNVDNIDNLDNLINTENMDYENNIFENTIYSNTCEKNNILNANLKKYSYNEFKSFKNKISSSINLISDALNETNFLNLEESSIIYLLNIYLSENLLKKDKLYEIFNYIMITLFRYFILLLYMNISYMKK